MTVDMTEIRIRVEYRIVKKSDEITVGGMRLARSKERGGGGEEEVILL